ncbi:MAG: aldo/keto reductase, partial [bacterium]
MEYISVDDVTIPALGLGTYDMKGKTCREACLHGLELGYRHLDTAQMYDNESAVGQAIRESDIPREDVFL